MPKWSVKSRRSVGLGVVVATAAVLLSAAGLHAEDVSHPPKLIQSMGETYECDNSAPLSKAAADARESAEGKLHLVGWVPMTHAVYAVHRADDDVYVRFGSRYYPCQISRSAMHAD